MGLTFSDVQLDLRAVVRSFLAETAEGADRRQAMATGGPEPRAWTRMANELGLQGLAIPEEYGGSGGSFVDLAIVLEETGRSLLVAPYLPTVLAGQALLAVGDERARARWLPAVADGAVVATVALTEDPHRFGVDGLRVRARRAGDHWLLTGAKQFVIDGGAADLVLVAACDDTGAVGLFAVEGNSDGLVRRNLEGVDPTRRLSHLDFTDVAAVSISDPGVNPVGLQRIVDVTLGAIVAEQLGGAQRCLDMAVEYAKTRVQFGRPIGSFQAVKHSCADMWLQVEAARSAAHHLWETIDAGADGDGETTVAAALAKEFCSRAYTDVAKRNIQIHGGIAITWEHDAHLYLKRAKSSELLCGSPDHHRRRVADLVGI
ncbi:acyl-CoA dehydrogenase family protein [Rhodococcus koreensis]